MLLFRGHGVGSIIALPQDVRSPIKMVCGTGASLCKAWDWVSRMGQMVQGPGRTCFSSHHWCRCIVLG